MDRIRIDDSSSSSDESVVDDIDRDRDYVPSMDSSTNDTRDIDDTVISTENEGHHESENEVVIDFIDFNQ